MTNPPQGAGQLTGFVLGKPKVGLLVTPPGVIAISDYLKIATSDYFLPPTASLYYN